MWFDLYGRPRRSTVLRVARARYDFAVDGGTIGDIDLDLDVEIPADCYVTHGYIVVDTAPTSAGAASLALRMEAADDIAAAASITAAPWSIRGRKVIVPVTGGITAVKTAAAQASVTATIGGAALTGGVFDVVLYYAEVPAVPARSTWC